MHITRAAILPLTALICALALPVAAQVAAPPAAASRAEWCGEVLTIATHDGSSTHYNWSAPASSVTPDPATPVTLLLLAGGSGHVDLNERGCPRALRGNAVVRAIPGLNAAGLGTALVDAPSDFQDEDGLAGFRTDPRHADDLGKLIAALRARTGGAVWLLGSSRGSISAVNAAARLTGPAAPDGLVLVSAITAGQARAKKRWVAQTVFDLPLESIRVPVLVVGHAADQCVRSPPQRMGEVTARTAGAREQVVTAKGGPGWSGPAGTAACDGRAPHSFFQLEDELAAGIARFVRGGDY